MSFLDLYGDPVVAMVTRQSDWRIRDLVEGAHPTTLYLVVPPLDIARCLDRMVRQIERLERHVTISNEAIATLCAFG